MQKVAIGFFIVVSAWLVWLIGCEPEEVPTYQITVKLIPLDPPRATVIFEPDQDKYEEYERVNVRVLADVDWKVKLVEVNGERIPAAEKEDFWVEMDSDKEILVEMAKE